ncbi:unnamed protein product [Mytilus edulis]|uniref:Uncharacterized protein n=1 Tax=Mytilus edulis TaxID=6550 RepID=A0A8S3U666_MYTED|nr:unnamed protein product [Mytilus edulis]
MADPAIQDASIALYRYMCHTIVGTEEFVKKFRAMNNARDNLTSTENKTTIPSGSFGEGLKMRGSDIDIMEVTGVIEVCENIIVHFNSNKTYFKMETEEAQPCFTQLRRIHSADCSEKAVSYNILGIILQLVGDKKSAELAFMNSVQIFPEAELNSAFQILSFLG